MVCTHLLLWTLNADADVLLGGANNDGVGVTEEVQTVLEEHRFERH